jgi:hypothetical protein
MNTEKETLKKQLNAACRLQLTAELNENWDEAQKHAETMMNLCHQLHLLELKQKEKEKL